MPRTGRVCDSGKVEARTPFAAQLVWDDSAGSSHRSSVVRYVGLTNRTGVSMAIIRNERKSRRESEPQQSKEREEIEVDYDWHPTEDEYVSPLTAEDWAELLSDEDFAETDAANAIRCLRDYGEPATFQQLSIRYRGTMGRYRRWLSEAAQAAAERFGIPAPQQDQFGMDEWWPLLYQTRTTGKIGAGVFEMLLRPEVDEAFELIAEQERQAKRAENARNLKRIEQLERARQEERQRKAERAAARQEERRREEERKREAARAQAAEEQRAAQAAKKAEETKKAEEERAAKTPKTPAKPAPKTVEATPVPEPETPPSTEQEAAGNTTELPAVRAYLEAMKPMEDAAHAEYARRTESFAMEEFSEVAPVDLALRYAERMRHVAALMHEGAPWLNLAALARAVGDESVEPLQSMLNGQSVPSFSYLNSLRDGIWVNLPYLEARDGLEEDLPAFCTLSEACGIEDVAAALLATPPAEIAYVVDDSNDRRSSVVVRYDELRCTLLSRGTVSATGDRNKDRTLDAYMRMVDELDGFGNARGIKRTTRQVTAAEWDAIAEGRAWPGKALR